MSEDDYDVDIARRLAARLEQVRPIRRIAAPKRQRDVGRFAAALVAGALAVSAVGIGVEINAAAEEQGLGCLDAMEKIGIIGERLVERIGDMTIDERDAAKRRLGEYAASLRAQANCSVDDRSSPKPSPKGAVPQVAPPAKIDPSSAPTGK